MANQNQPHRVILALPVVLVLLLPVHLLRGQEALIKGRIVDEQSKDPLPYANVVIPSLEQGATTDEDGRYQLQVPPGLYNLKASFVGYKSQTQYEVQATTAQPQVVNFELEESAQTLETVEVSAQQQFNREKTSPVSVSTLGINEIRRNPGGNQDISLVIQSLPGVASSANFRNDVIIRGGAPNENAFYLDGIEIPSINHFATQGSSGGPVGLINVNFLRETELYTSAFPVNKANALSGILDLKLKDGRDDRLGGTFQVGASEVGLTMEGPLGDSTTFLASVRRSYLQFLFSVLELPFLPTYNDFQFKVKHQIDAKNRLTLLGLGALDEFELNKEANDTRAQRLQLASLPVNEQWNYSIGAKWTHFGENSYTNVILSRFMLNNEAFKFAENDRSQRQLYDYRSRQVENKFRLEHNRPWAGFDLKAGAGAEEIKYSTEEEDLRGPPSLDKRSYSTDLREYEYTAFASINRSFFQEKLNLTAGLRMEGNTFNASTANPWNQLSPKIALRYNFDDALSFNASYSIYHQLPPFTALGFRDTTGRLVNEDLRYISTRHYVAGLAYYLDWNAKISLEGFYKDYQDYPFLSQRGITLANLGSDFGVIGNEPARSSRDGRALGMEVLYQQKLFQGFFGTLAYTLVRSEFEDAQGDLVPSSWDNRHIISLTGGKKFGENWEIGLQYQFLGGAPYTPIDVYTSSLVPVYNANRRGLPDYDRLNERRFEGFNRLNVRVDKKWFFEQWSLNVYLDVRNALGESIQGIPLLAPQLDQAGDPITFSDPETGARRYRTERLSNETGTTLPSIGLIVQF